MNQSRSTASGHSAIELVAALLVLIPIVLFAIDIVTVYFGSTVNNGVCRDAARAAAGGPPSEAEKRAQAVVRRANKTEGAIRLRTDDQYIVVTSSVTRMPKPPWGGQVEGTVTVQTSCEVYPPFLMRAVNPKVVIDTRQTFPFTYVMPSTYNTTTP